MSSFINRRLQQLAKLVNKKGSEVSKNGNKS